jgi:hypothetical protein
MAKSSKVSVALDSALSADRIAAQAAIVSKLAQATPTHVVQAKRASGAASYVLAPFTSFEVSLFTACVALERAAWEADNKRALIAQAIKGHFGATAPTYAQYKALQEAMHLQAVEAGFTGQMIRKHVAHGVKSAYGALPESDSPAAIAKRAQRPGKTAKQAKPDAAASFKAGVEHAQSKETIESFIARVGIVATLSALNRILAAEDSTKDAAAFVLEVIPMVQTA